MMAATIYLHNNNNNNNQWIINLTFLFHQNHPLLEMHLSLRISSDQIIKIFTLMLPKLTIQKFAFSTPGSTSTKPTATSTSTPKRSSAAATTTITTECRPSTLLVTTITIIIIPNSYPSIELAAMFRLFPDSLVLHRLMDMEEITDLDLSMQLLQLHRKLAGIARRGFYKIRLVR